MCLSFSCASSKIPSERARLKPEKTAVITQRGLPFRNGRGYFFGRGCMWSWIDILVVSSAWLELCLQLEGETWIVQWCFHRGPSTLLEIYIFLFCFRLMTRTPKGAMLFDWFYYNKKNSKTWHRTGGPGR